MNPLKLDLSAGDLLEIFPDAKRIIPQKIREWNLRRKTVVTTIRQSLSRAENYDYTLAEMVKEMNKLVLGPKLSEIDSHLARLHRHKQLVDGKQPTESLSEHLIQQARSFPIENLPGIELQRSGRRLRGLCPFHEERSPSFTVYPDGGGFFCFGCNKGGDSIAFVQLKYGYGFVQAVRFLTAA